MEEGYRKAVNSRIQGSAADLMKAAMVAVEQWAAQQQWQPPRPVRCVEGNEYCSATTVYICRMVAQVHDELVFVVDTTRCNLQEVARAIQGAMSGAPFHVLCTLTYMGHAGALPLRVPVTVTVKAGTSMGSLSELAL